MRLQGHHDDPYGTRSHVQRQVLGAARVDGAHCEHRPEGLEERVGQIMGGRLQHQAEPDNKGRPPDEELGDKGGGGGRRQDGVLRFVRPGEPGQGDEPEPDAAVHPE